MARYLAETRRTSMGGLAQTISDTSHYEDRTPLDGYSDGYIKHVRWVKYQRERQEAYYALGYRAFDALYNP